MEPNEKTTSLGQELARLRHLSLTPDQRSAIASKASRARWGEPSPERASRMAKRRERAEKAKANKLNDSQ